MSERCRQEAVAIWKAAVAAVDSEQLIRRNLAIDGNVLIAGDQEISLQHVRCIEVVGAGKAGAGMARGVEHVFTALPAAVDWSGWLNVPDDCVPGDSSVAGTTAGKQRIALHGARPAGVNEPTEAGVEGTQEILRRVSALDSHDLCLVLISGGGSALLPAPVAGVSLADKLAVTRLLAAGGASIHELNAVRSRISNVKGGGLARACSAGQLVALIVSDVIGDPLDIIASGPTCDFGVDAAVDPMEILRRYDPELQRVPASVLAALRLPEERDAVRCEVHNHIIGSNRVALKVAQEAAVARGYHVESWGSENDGTACDLGQRFFQRLQQLKRVAVDTNTPQCLLAGGETTVALCDAAQRGRGGRNQEIVLSAVAEHPAADEWRGLAMLSGGTDGEDGPTPAAGAVADDALVERLAQSDLDPARHLETNNAWPFFDQLDGLINTGPTHTNVMDVQVGLALP